MHAHISLWEWVGNGDCAVPLWLLHTQSTTTRHGVGRWEDLKLGEELSLLFLQMTTHLVCFTNTTPPLFSALTTHLSPQNRVTPRVTVSSTSAQHCRQWTSPACEQSPSADVQHCRPYTVRTSVALLYAAEQPSTYVCACEGRASFLRLAAHCVQRTN